MNVATGTRATLIPDVIGSIVGSLDSGGTLTKFGYQTFGENPSLTSGGYRYTGRRLDPETVAASSQPSGLYYYRARTYSPTWGRFLQPDPSGYPAGANLYAYTNNDPLNQTDPSGLCYPACTTAAGALIGGVAGGAYYLYSASHPSFVGFLGSTAEGAISGGVAGSGASLFAIAAISGTAHVVTQFTTAAADTNLERYGSSTLNNVAVIGGDLAVGASLSVGGVYAGRYLAPVVSNTAASVAASVLANPSVSSATTAFVLRSAEPAAQYLSQFATDIASSIISDQVPVQKLAHPGK